MFDARSLTRGRGLVLAGAVEVRLEGDRIAGHVRDPAGRHAVRLTPSSNGRRVAFDRFCSCGEAGCPHLAAAAFAALDQFPALRRPEQQSFLDTLLPTAEPVAEAEGERTVLELAPAFAPYACAVTTLRVGERSGTVRLTTPQALDADPATEPELRALARMLGGGSTTRSPVPANRVDDVLTALVASGRGRWHKGGRRLIAGEERRAPAGSTPPLPDGSGVIIAPGGPWYVDAGSGAVGRLRAIPVAPPRATAAGKASVAAPRTAPGAAPGAATRVADARAPVRRRSESVGPTEQVIVERQPRTVLRLTRFACPDEYGRMRDLDALLLEFDYEGVVVRPDDERQFLRVEDPAGPIFVRRDRKAEAAALEALQRDGLMQMRMAEGQAAKGRLVFVFRGRDAAEAWQTFLTERLPVLRAQGWRGEVDPTFGPRLATSVGACDLRIADVPRQGFSLDFGIEVEGVRHKLLPILLRLRERGGMAAARIVGGELITSLDDGRILGLPAERIRQLLAVVDDLMDTAHRGANETLVLHAAEAPVVLDLEDLVTARWQDGARIATQVARLRGLSEIPEIPIPGGFNGELRPYQRQGVNWLQHLRENDLGGLLADDMGLGKTAQTIAHIVVEKAAGRLDRPALVVVPTSLVPNWTAELARFAPGLRVVVLHGGDRHQRRGELDRADVVITTYTVLSRDIEEMSGLAWHMVVLDEAQAIKSATAKATHAVCRLDARHRLCLSGTPIENNLGELWSQFAFLMPGLLGHRKSFTKRFRTPIEKQGDPVRRGQLARRIRPFILRRTKAVVATELPPKHTILRRITLAPAQRELYETIRATLHERVSQEIAEHSLARSHVVVLDALLKLRQVCCDPRLVKLPSARLTATSSKLDDLLEMVGEMIAEGRRILLFSQFTSMLDLMKPALTEAGIRFVELRGDTGDRAEPVRRFEAGEVPLFLISLKAGGRGLNLVAADTVIHYDPWWNPAVEEQASDRAHRIGQTKSVFVYKLIAADTVEERILELQERKAALARIAFSDDATALPGLEAEDVDFLFGPTLDRMAA